MSELKNVDDTLIRAMSDNAQAPVQPVSAESQQPSEPVLQAQEPVELPKPANDPESDPEPPESPANPLPEAAEAGKGEDDGSPIDEYGNPVAKPKMYTEEEVQRMIRDRLSRGRQAEVQPPVPPQPEPVQPQQQGEENWEAQLEQFVERTIEKRQAKTAEQQYRQTEAQRQAEFESKFNTGMNRYGDFHQVVQGKPITDTMMLATRALDDPAAFVYGASRMHPQEIDRISRISDPYAVAAEVGRLHERMVKERKALSNAPKPVDAPRGDMPRAGDSKIPIDTLIAQHAKARFARR